MTRAPRPDPGATYRVQLHAGFGFADAAAIAPYLAELGITHLYCSPYLQAAPGSTHGYDVVDHSHLNSELGGPEGFLVLTEALTAAGLGQVLDIVPNHMAIAGRANRWWWDVLENGPSSRYAACFDIDWDASEGRHDPAVLVPVLGDHYGREIDAGQIGVEREGGAFRVRYHDHELPVSPRTLGEILVPATQRTRSPELARVAAELASLPHARRTDAGAVEERHRRKEELRELLEHLAASDPTIAAAIDDEVGRLNRDPDRLDALLRRQNYRLAHWRTASEELDYRRFFNIETLVGLRQEDESVFAATHLLVLELVGTGVVQGLRIDHVDGLRDPAGYLTRLHRASGGTYTVVEKILEAGEELPPDWPIAGTSGYDFLTRVNNLFVDTELEPAMTHCYEGFTGQTATYREIVREAKLQVAANELATEVERLTRMLAAVCDNYRRHRDHTFRALREALVELLVAFPVYRTYAQPGQPVAEADRARVAEAVHATQAVRPEIDAELVEFIGELLVLGHEGPLEAEFAVRFAQASSPVMAKGVEDTAFYRYNRLISLNEVGGDPGVYGRPVADFHRDTVCTLARWPDTMLTLSTHDTKRSADVRARINLLSEIPGAWETALTRLADAAGPHRRDGWPDANTEYLLYQTLVGAWPIGADRMTAFVSKAGREAKVHTSWVEPDAGYEEAVESFVRGVLGDPVFVDVLEGFLGDQQLVERGRVNSLAQTALLLTCPGVPDIYQGSELWDLSLVDPDNRRPVDFATRAVLLAGDAAAAPPKLRMIHRLLNHRRDHPAVHRPRTYEPLPAGGPQAAHVVAFTTGGLSAVVPRLVMGRTEPDPRTTVGLPGGRWVDLLSGAAVDGGQVPVAALLASFPVAVLARTDT